MHVLLLPSWYPETPSSLDGIFFRQQAHALQRAGLRVGVVAPLFRSPRRLREIFSGRYGTECFSDGPIPTYTRHSVYFFPRIPYLDRERWVAAGMRLFERYLAEQGRPDILHAHAVNHGGILAHRISRRHGIPYVITEHSSTYARGLIRPWQHGLPSAPISAACWLPNTAARNGGICPIYWARRFANLCPKGVFRRPQTALPSARWHI